MNRSKSNISDMQSALDNELKKNPNLLTTGRGQHFMLHNLPVFPKRRLPAIKRNPLVPAELAWVFENIGYGGKSYLDAPQGAFMEPKPLLKFLKDDFKKITKEYGGDPITKEEEAYITKNFNKVIVFQHLDHGDEVMGYDLMTKKVIDINFDRDKTGNVNRFAALRYAGTPVGEYITDYVTNSIF